MACSMTSIQLMTCFRDSPSDFLSKMHDRLPYFSNIASKMVKAAVGDNGDGVSEHRYRGGGRLKRTPFLKEHFLIFIHCCVLPL